MSTKGSTNARSTASPPPAYRVFISSTYDDMKEYRAAASEALTNIQAIPMGMERFTSSTQPVIERCYEEIQQCQFCVCLIGFRYGSLYKDTNYSYSELEFNEAERQGIPILVFIRKGSIDTSEIDINDFGRLSRYKNKLQKSASNRLIASFTSPEDLRDKLTRALQDEFKRKTDSNEERQKSKKESPADEEEAHLNGAATFKNFILMPGKYCDQTVRLRIRFDGTYGTWRLKEELFEAFNMPIGRALYMNDLFVLGTDYSDIDDDNRHIDAFAVGNAAKWIRDNGITKGSVFEGEFRLEWKYVKDIAGKARFQIGASNAYIAKLVLLSGDLKLITQGSNTAIRKDSQQDIEERPRTPSQQDRIMEFLGLMR